MSAYVNDLSEHAWIPGNQVTYHHAMLGEDIRASVFSVSQRGVVIEFDDAEHGWPRDRRFLTHKQAGEVLS
jgi:hypothetical protein